jgi:hypothetical protein
MRLSYQSSTLNHAETGVDSPDEDTKVGSDSWVITEQTHPPDSRRIRQAPTQQNRVCRSHHIKFELYNATS